jgi:hypothetical protein
VLTSLSFQISQYGGLSVLILRSIKLQKLDDFVLPKLQYVDLSKNMLKTVKACVAMFKHSPFLEVIKLQDNPVTRKLSYRSKVRFPLFLSFQLCVSQLRSLNPFPCCDR